MQGRLSDAGLYRGLVELVDDTDFYRRRHAGLAVMVSEALRAIRSSHQAGRLLGSGAGKLIRQTADPHGLYMDVAARMPRSLAHGDFNFMNLRTAPPGEAAAGIAVIDWQYGGYRPIGADIAGFVADSSAYGVRRRIGPATVFFDDCLAAYCDGLDRGGFAAPIWKARLAVMCHLLGHWGLVTALTLKDAFRSGRSHEERAERLARFEEQTEMLFERILPEADGLMARFLSGDGRDD